MPRSAGGTSPFLRVKLLTRGVRLELRSWEPVLLESNQTWRQLVDTLRDNFVPWVECDRKCPACEICPFTVTDPERPGRFQEIRCGYQIHVISHFLQYTLPLLKPRTQMEMSRILRACLQSKEFLFHAFTASAGVIDKDYLRWLDSSYFQHLYFSAGGVVGDAESFSAAARALSLPFALPITLFVEGKWERVVLESAFTSLSAVEDMEIRDLGGNMRTEYLRGLLVECKRQNRQSALVLDRTTQQLSGRLKKLLAEDLIKPEYMRVLPGDFEDLFPAPLLESIVTAALTSTRLEAAKSAISDVIGRKRYGFTQCLRRKLIDEGVAKGHLTSAEAAIKNAIAHGLVAEIKKQRPQVHQAILTWRDRRFGPRRFNKFIHLCRWILHLQGKELRRHYLRPD